MLKVSKTLFDTLEASLNTEAKRICKDVSKILNIPEKELQSIILNPKIQIKIIKDETPISCPALIENGIIERCRLPCILGTGRCYKHQEILSIPETTRQTLLTRIQSPIGSLWCDEKTGTVYNRSSEIVGIYKNSRLTIFTLCE
jgi:hypothetical protein